MQRREFLRLGLGLGTAGGLGLTDLLRFRAHAAETTTAAPAGMLANTSQPRTALIVLACHGGISHIDTWDPKPDAPAEYRGPFSTIETRAPGLFVTELLPMHAEIADKISLLRSVSHQAVCHANGPQRLLTGHFTPRQEWRPDHPDFLAVTNYLRWQPGRPIPNYIGLTSYGVEFGPIPALGPAYLGEKYAPFAIREVPGKQGTKGGLVVDTDGRLGRRGTLLGRLDKNLAGTPSELMSEFQHQALDILCRPDAQRAFDLDQEPAEVRDRYGRSSWGQECLIARRLVEAGVDLVTVTLCGPEAGGAENWDDHAVNCNIFPTLKKRAEIFDRCVTALISDLYDRGLDQRVMVMMTGEFGRTPLISRAIGTATRVEQPGRDHWPQAMSILLAGGGVPGGQVIGATNRRGEYPVSRNLDPWDLIATLYTHLGIDARNITVPDSLGRPISILPEGEPIRELVAVS